MRSAQDVLIGRAREQEALSGFLAGVGHGHSSCLLEGEPGIGKTALWRWCVGEARERSFHVLAHAATRAERGLAYAGVDALLGSVGETVLDTLPPLQRRALGVALLQEEPGVQPPDQRLIGAAFRGVVRALALDSTVLVAVDDVQWLDEASAVVLAYAMRRLPSEPAGLLLARRVAPAEEPPWAMSDALADDRAVRLAVPALPRDGVRWLLAERLGPELPQQAARRVWETSGGNPLFALELGRALLASGSQPAPGQPLPVPATLGGLVQSHLASLPATTRELLLVAAAAVAPTPELVAAASGWSTEDALAALEAAADAGVLVSGEDEVRFSHPLFAETLLAGTTAARRRRVHACLAAVVPDVEQRARHAALAAGGPDETVAGLLETAAESAAARGAPQPAAELSELAARLTPGDAPADMRRRRRRSAALAYRAGDLPRARQILEEELPLAPAGASRAELLISLGGMHWDDFPRAVELLTQGLREAGDDRRLTCLARLQLGDIQSLAGTHLQEALATVRPAIADAEQTGDEQLLMKVLSMTALLESYAGSVTPGVLERALELERAGVTAPGSEPPSNSLGRQLKFEDRYEEARSVLESALERTAGDAPARYSLLTNLTDLECRAGDFAAAESWAAQAIELAELFGLEEQGGPALHCKAVVEAHLGRVDAARAAAERGIAVSAAVGDAIFDVYNRGVLGFLELSLGDASAADRWLRPLVPRTQAMGNDEPAGSRFWVDAIEALVGTGDLVLARDYLERFEQMPRVAPRPWVAAAAARCHGMLAAAEGDHEAALSAFDAALAEHENTSAFEHARTLLALGQTHRRAKRKRPARDALERALAIFEQAGTPLWAARARAELGRIGGRAPATTELTPTESRVAHLVVQGHSNKQVAAALFVTVHTVEANLTRIYRKLGVRSRTELASRLTAADPAS